MIRCILAIVLLLPALYLLRLAQWVCPELKQSHPLQNGPWFDQGDDTVN